MQERHRNRAVYFQELATTSQKYFIPYIKRFKPLSRNSHILEVGCGDGGNLLPFAVQGCHTVGIDIASCRIRDAREFFKNNKARGTFIASDLFELTRLHGWADVIIVHDVIEHIHDKRRLLGKLCQFLARNGLIFMSFPAWQMPFGGHQQICANRFISHLPFVHLLPTGIYRRLLKLAGESEGCICELMVIKETRTPIELFEETVQDIPGLRIIDRTLWLINPHYETKFGLKPQALPQWISQIPHIRNVLTTSCFYLLMADRTETV